MIVNFNNENYIIKWKHTHPVTTQEITEEVKELMEKQGDDPMELNGRLFFVPNKISYGSTECYIKLENHILTEGYAKCSKSDKFNKKIGREISLKKALDYDIYDKEFRSKVWEIYKKEIKHISI